MFKKFILSLSAFFVTIFLFTGCASIEAMSIVYADSSRALDYAFSLNKTTLASHGIAYDDALAVAKECADDYWAQLGYHFDTTQASYVSAVNSKTSNFEVRITFDGYEKYCKFHNTTMEAQSKIPPTLEEGFLMTKNIVLDSKNGVGNIFLDIRNQPYQTETQTLTQTVGEVMIDTIATHFGKTKTEIENLIKSVKVKFSFAFASGLKMHSNADLIRHAVDQAGVGNQEAASYTVHTWQCDFSQSPHVLIYKNVLTRNNLYAWYGVGIAAAIVFGLILWIVFYIKHKNSESVYLQKNFPSASEGDMFDRTQDYDMPQNETNSAQNEDIEAKKEENKGVDENKNS